MKIIYLWASALISYVAGILFAFNQELIGAVGLTVLTLVLLVSTKCVNIEN